jgi:thiamine-phosphate pyrophosphorylase
MEFKPEMLQTYLIAGTADVPDGQLLKFVERALKAGITAFQYREKGLYALTGVAKANLGKQLLALCHDYDVPLIIDNDIDLAVQLHADGIHVGQTDTDIRDVIKAVGPETFVGLSCHTAAQIRVANEVPEISYIGSGAVFPSPSKHGSPVIGLAGLRDLVQLSRVPVVAIGGIDETNIIDLPATGVAGASVISMMTQSPNIEATIALMNQIQYLSAG